MRIIAKYEKDGEDYFPEIKNEYDVYNYIDHLYNTKDLICVKHKLHILDKLPRKPMLLHNLTKNYKIDGGKYGQNFIITHKTSKVKYDIEFERDSIAISKQEKPRQRLLDFKFYWSSMLSDLF